MSSTYVNVNPESSREAAPSPPPALPALHRTPQRSEIALVDVGASPSGPSRSDDFGGAIASDASAMQSAYGNAAVAGAVEQGEISAPPPIETLPGLVVNEEEERKSREEPESERREAQEREARAAEERKRKEEEEARSKEEKEREARLRETEELESRLEPPKAERAPAVEPGAVTPASSAEPREASAPEAAPQTGPAAEAPAGAAPTVSAGTTMPAAAEKPAVTTPTKTATAGGETAAPEAAAKAGAAEGPKGVGAAPSEAESAKSDAALETIASGDPDSVIEGLSHVAPSRSAVAMLKARSSSADAFDEMHQDLAENPPTVPRPSGLHRKGDEAPEADAAKGKEEKPEEVEAPPGEQSEIDLTHEPSTAPLPASGAVMRSVEAAPDEGDALSRAASGTLERLPTSDETVDTSAGTRPVVELTGEADTGQMTEQLAINRTTFDVHRATADLEIGQDYGENDIYPTVPDEMLSATVAPGRGKPGAAFAQSPEGVPDVVITGFDQNAAGRWSEELALAREDHQQAKDQKAADEFAANDHAASEIARLNDETAARQTDAQTQAQIEVDAARGAWADEIDAADQTYSDEAKTLREDTQKQIDDEKTHADEDARKELEAAEGEAGELKRKAGVEAEEKKKEAEEESSGFWGWLKSGVESFIDGIRGALNFIFDQLRAAVKWVIEKAKAAALWVIEQARKAIVGLIKGFGALLCLAADVFLAAFPEARDKFKAAINDGVEYAENAVNEAAEVLKEGVSAALDALGAALDFVLEFYQKAYNAILDVIEFLAVGLLEIMERIGHLVTAAEQMPDHFEGQMYEEIIGRDLTKPMPFERGAPPEPEDAMAAAVAVGAVPREDAAVLNKTTYTDEDITVDSVAPLDLDPELLESVGISDEEEIEEGEIEFGETAERANSIEALQAEMGGEIGPAATEPTPETAAESAEPVEAAGPEAEAAGAEAETPEQETERRLQEMMAHEPEGACTQEKPTEQATESSFPENLKFGPLTKGQRARYLLDQMWKGIKHWFSCNWKWLLAAAIAALVGIIILEILTAGLITAALPIILSIIAAVMIGVAIVEMASRLLDYLVKGWNGDIAGSAQALARALAIGAVELIFAVLFAVTGGIFTAVKASAKAFFKFAGKAAKAAGKGLAKAGVGLGKLAVKAGGAVARRGRIVMKGVKAGFERGVKTLDDLARRLRGKVRFRKFKIKRTGRRIQLFGYINPWVLLADGSIEQVTIKGKRPELGMKYKIPGRKKPGIIVGVVETTAEGEKMVSAFVKDLQKLSKTNPAKAKALYKDLEKLSAEARWAKIAKSSLTAKHAQELREAMNAAGKTLKAGEEAHHIVPSTHTYPSADQARKILGKYGIKVNEAVNGVPLKESLHEGLHTHKYMDKVYDLLKGAKSRQAVEAALKDIEDLIKAGKFP
jgi:hypothetical protein